MGGSVLAAFNRLTIKVGSALLVDGASGELRRAWLASLVSDIAKLKAEGRDIVLVSSGAIALGRRILGLERQKLVLEQEQAAASAGQIALSQAWAAALQAHGLVAGQILITPNITEERRYFLNARTTINALLKLGAVPIINENDSVATAEIRYGDNDRLSARVAAMVEADCLVILSDVDGLYDAPPHRNPDARHMAHVEKITPEIEAMAGGAANHLSRGGMLTKIEAAKIATSSGTAMFIAPGAVDAPLSALADGGRHTFFEPEESPSASRKRWILGSLTVAGQVLVDAGAAKALLSGKSLLPVGVTAVRGDFSRGDAISIVGPAGEEIARGLSGYDSAEARASKGKKGAVVEEMFGFSHRIELVHADNLVLLRKGGEL